MSDRDLIRPGIVSWRTGPSRPRRWLSVAAVGLLGLTACSNTASKSATPSEASASVVETIPATDTAPASESEPETKTVPATESVETSAASVASNGSEPEGGEGGNVVVGLGGEPPTLDPAANSLSLENGSIYEALFDRLMDLPDLDGTGPPVPMLLESLTESADRLTWTLKARPNVKFHDGTPFNAEAIKFNLDRQRSSLYNGASLSLLTSVNIVDPSTVTVVLKQPWVGLPTAFTTIVGVMAAPSAFGAGKDGQRNPIGTGPFKFVEWVPGSHVKVARNTDFWATPAKVDGIEYKFVPDETARYTALKSKSLDAMTTATETRTKQAAADGFTIIAPPPNGFGLTMYNLTREPLKDVRVRRALTLAVDRDAQAKAFDGDDYSKAGFGPYQPGNRWFVPPEEPQKFDPAGAKALLADYGKPVKFTYVILAGDATTIDLLRSTIDYWKEVGIDATLKIVPDLTTYVTNVFTGNFDAAGWIGGTSREPDATFYNLVHTGASMNFMKYSNPELDALLDEGRASLDDARRLKIYAEVQQILRRDLPISVVAHGKIRILLNDNVTAQPTFFFPARTVALKK